MRIALFTLLASAAVAVQATDVKCPKNRWQTTITLEVGDKFKFRTQAGRVYRGPVKCTVNYKLGNTCDKARFWCDRSFIRNEDRRSCSRGDKMIVRAGNTMRTYCGKRRARINAFGQIKVSFLANRRGRDRGAICNVECTRGNPDVLLVVGGYDGDYYLNSSEVYGSPTCSVPKLSIGRDSVKAVYFDSQVLACGGDSNDGVNDTMCYTLGASGWSEHSNMTSERYFGSPVVVGDSLYMLGGYGGVERYSSVVLAAGSNVWGPGPDIPGATYYSCAVALGDGFVIIGADYDTDYNTQVLQYDGSSWDNWANLTTGRKGPSCLLFGNSIIVAGGYGNGDYLATTVKIDTVTKISSPGPEMTMPRYRFIFANVNGLLLAVGGYDGDNYHPSGEIFDLVNGGTLYQNMTIGRSYLIEGAVMPKGSLAEIIGCP